MLIKLTNVSEGHMGDPIWINADNIVSLFQFAKVPNGSLTTFVYGSTGVTWEVEEAPGEVLKLIGLHEQMKRK
jgi:hypothetical protein